MIHDEKELEQIESTETTSEDVTKEKKDSVSEKGKVVQAASLKKKIERLEKKDREHDMRPISGTFKNFQSPTLETVFSCRKYKEEPITTYKLRDGETATLPYYVAKMLRQECYYKRNQLYKGTNGVEEIKLGEKVKLMDFFPHNEFIQGTEAENSIVQVKMNK